MSAKMVRRLQTHPFLPLSLLLLFVLALGWLHSEVLTPYARPILVGDQQGALAFYDAASVDPVDRPGFVFRRRLEPGVWSKERRVEGELVSAALRDDRLALLFPGFLSLYERSSLKRTRTVSTAGLDFEAEHLIWLAEDLYVIGLDKGRALRAARLTAGAFAALEAAAPDLGRWTRGTGAEAKAAPPPEAEPEVKKEPTDEAPAEDRRVKERAEAISLPRIAWSHARDGEGALVLLSISARARRERAPPRRRSLTGRYVEDLGGMPAAQRLERRLRMLRFDGRGFGPVIDLARRPIAAELWSGEDGPELLEVAALESEAVTRWDWRDGRFQKKGSLALTVGGFFKRGSVSSLAAARGPDGALAVAQIGGKIWLRGLAPEGSWRTLAQLPGETQALVYAWFAAVLALAGLLVIAGLRRLRRRPKGPPPPGDLAELLRGVLIPGQEGALLGSSDDTEREPDRPGGDGRDEEGEAEGEEERAEATGAAASGRSVEAGSIAAEDAPRDAGISERALAFLIDLGVLFILISTLSFLVPLGLAERLNDGQPASSELIVDSLQEVYFRIVSGQALLSPEMVVLAAFQVLFGLLYFTSLEGATGRTIGKAVLGLEVRGVDGRPLGWRRSFFRNALRIELFQGLGGLALLLVSLPMMVLTARTQRPGDYLARSVVVKRPAPIA